jgi:hypothetical protein
MRVPQIIEKAKPKVGDGTFPVKNGDCSIQTGFATEGTEENEME